MNRIKLTIKWILGIAVIVAGITSFTTSILSGVLFLTAGVLLLSPSLKFIQEKSGKTLSRKTTYIAITLCLFVGFFFRSQQKIDKESSLGVQVEEAEKLKVAFQEYKNDNASNLSRLGKRKEKIRKEILDELSSNKVFLDLTQNKIVDQKYLVIMQAIGYGMVSITTNETFTITETLDKKIKQLPDGHRFVLNVIRLDLYGGIPDNLLDAFDKYRTEYKMSGYKGDVTYQSDGTVKYKLDSDFTLVQLLGVIDRKNPEVLDAYYEAINAKQIDWQYNDENYVYFYLTDKYAFNTYLKQNHPDSKYYVQYDIKTTASNLYQEYDNNEVAADEKYKGKNVAITGTIQDIGKDISDDAYITLSTGNFGVVQCSFTDANVVKSLTKGERLTVVGRCSGKTLGNILLFDSILF